MTATPTRAVVRSCRRAADRGPSCPAATRSPARPAGATRTRSRPCRAPPWTPRAATRSRTAAVRAAPRATTTGRVPARPRRCRRCPPSARPRAPAPRPSSPARTSTPRPPPGGPAEHRRVRPAAAGPVRTGPVRCRRTARRPVRAARADPAAAQRWLRPLGRLRRAARPGGSARRPGGSERPGRHRRFPGRPGVRRRRHRAAPAAGAPVPGLHRPVRVSAGERRERLRGPAAARSPAASRRPGAPDRDGRPAAERRLGASPASGPGDGRTPLYDTLETNWFHGDREARAQQDAPTAAPEPQASQPQTPAAPQRPAASAWRSSPNDDLVRQAERVRQPAAGGVTTSGLPRRVPRANLVPGTAQQQSHQNGPQVSRAPDDVRGRLTNLRRGIAQGRQAGTNQTGSYPRPTHQQER